MTTLTTLRDLIDKLIDIENTGGTSALQDLPVIGCCSSSGSLYELCGASVEEADEEVKDRMAIEKGAKYVQIYLGS